MSLGSATADVDQAEHVSYELPLRTPAELEVFLWLTFGVRIPKRRVCPGHCPPWEAFCSAYFSGLHPAFPYHPVEVWKASRGLGGKSFLLALLGLTEAITWRAHVNVLGGSGEQSKRVHETMDGEHGWRAPDAPRHLLVTDPSQRETLLCHQGLADPDHRHDRHCPGNTVRALLASTRSVRGPHPQRLRLDEVDEMSLKILDAALGQTMKAKAADGWREIPAHTVLSSTHQYADGTMTEVLKRAHDRGWPVRSWCYRETLEPHGWLDPSEVARKRLEMTETSWLWEVELQEPSPEDRAIDTDAVRRLFRRDLGVYAGKDGEALEWEAPVLQGRYAHGADWGKAQHYTVIVTLRTDVRPMRWVAFERVKGPRPWPDLVARLDARIGRYGRASAAAALHDATGLGGVVQDLLRHDVEGQQFGGRDRDELLSEYIASIERGEMVAPLIQTAETEHRLATQRSVFGPGHLPDTIAAGALARRAVGLRPAGFPSGPSSTSYWRESAGR